MQVFVLPNLASHDVTPGTLPPATSARPPLKTKELFRAWCAEIGTQHVFYSVVEGLVPSLRISEANPPRLLHGFVADFDANVTEAMIADLVTQGSILPTWSSKTYSGGARLVWEFSEPILCDCKPLAERFMKIMAKELKVTKLLPAFDEASLGLNQYWEAGTNWAAVPGGIPISSDLVGLWVFQAASAKSLKLPGSGDMAIPIEEIAAEVSRQFPGRWVGEFAVGARGCLFWIPDGVSRVGCQVGDLGMLCYSSRADGAFLSWGEILGRDFVKRWEASQVGAYAETLWFDGKTYWWNVDDVWMGRGKEDSIMHLKNAGVPAKVGSKETASKAEKILCAVQNSRKVDMAAPLLFESQEVVSIKGDRVLNIGKRKAMMEEESEGAGDPANFPWLHEFFSNVFEPVGNQREVFLAWFQRFWLSARENNLAQGQVMVIAGEAGRGKTFLGYHIVGAALGGACDAGDYLTSETVFNKECAETAVWCIDDALSQSSLAEKKRFAENLKRQAANPTVNYHPKFKDAIQLPWRGRVMLTCNTDVESLGIVPQLDNTFADKVIMLKFSETWKPTFKANGAQEAMVAKELPFFLAWLKAWEPPSCVLDPRNPRYGVVPYHHPDMVTASEESTTEYSVVEIMERWRVQTTVSAELETRRLSCTELLEELEVVFAVSRNPIKNLIPRTLSVELRKLLAKKQYRPLKGYTRSKGITRFEFDMRIPV